MEIFTPEKTYDYRHDNELSSRYMVDDYNDSLPWDNVDSIISALEELVDRRQPNDRRKENVNAVFSRHMTQPIDRAFLLKVLTHVNGFVRKTESSIAFFGGNLIGVHPIKWESALDGVKWKEDVLQLADFDLLKEELHELPDINKNFFVSSDPINLSYVWVAYKGLTSTLLTPDQAYSLAHACINMLQYKFISSLQSHNFPHPANEAIALATYESLPNKFYLKKMGSWQAVFDMRTNEILGDSGIHSGTVRTLSDDHQIVRMINDISSRLRSMYNLIRNVYYAIKEQDDKISSTSKFMQIDGENIMKEYVNKYVHIKSVMRDVIPDQLAFIRRDLVTIVLDIINAAYFQHVNNALVYISENFTANKKIKIPEVMDDILMFSFEVIRDKKINVNHLPDIAKQLKGVLQSSRIASPEYKKIKEDLGVIVDLANPKIAESSNASAKIAIVLYITLRAFIETKKS